MSLPQPALTLKPIPLSAIDSLSDADYAAWSSHTLSSVTALLATLPIAQPSSDLWKPKRLYHGKTAPTQTWTSGRGKHLAGTGETQGLRWHARQTKVSREQGTYEQFKDGLLVEHSKKEKEYIEAAIEAKEIKVVKPGELEVWQMKYTNSPAAKRDFTFLILTRETTAPPPSPTSSPTTTTAAPAALHSFAVVSIPVDAPAEKGFVRGRYVSVEHVQETEEGGVLWTMAVSSDAGGWVPRLLSEWVMPGKIAEDVPSFLGWLKNRRS
ncbi:hypothetical protein JCM8547_000354 [Rhodosporidiobolus lusitaniae]